MPEGPLFSGGINAFIELKDTPASFVGQSGKTPIVKATEDKLEFATLAGGDMLTATYDPASKSEQLLGESDIVTTIGNPGSDTKVPSEQGIREALDVINQRKIKDQYYRVIASGNTTGTLTKPAGAGADVDFIMDGWGVSVDALLSKVDANDIPTFEPPVNAAGAIITTSFATNGNYTLTDTPSPAAKHAIVFIYTCYFQNFLIAESMQKTEWVGDVIYETDFNATSFLYATNKNIPENKTPAEVRAILNLEDGADVTDAVNIASSTHGVSAKATPVNADEMGLIDSAASWVLKKVTWTNIKATLKTYFDTLYAGDGANSDITSMTGLTTAQFAAHITSNRTDVTGDGTAYDLTGAIWTEDADRGNCFSNGTFTAKATKQHLFTGLIVFDTAVQAAHTYGYVALKTSNRDYYPLNGAVYNLSSSDALTVNFVIIADMDINDTAFIRVDVYNGTKIIDITVATRFAAYELQ